MRRETSILLEALRFFAAFFVVLNHFRNHIYLGLPAIIGWHGREAVAIFFVLSGFVIRFVTKNKETDGRSYAIARVARISSVVLPAICLTLILDFAGRTLSPAMYQGLGPDSAPAVLSALTFTNEIWFRHVVFGSNEPYWSMGFEVWYYFLFGAALYLRGATRAVVLVLLVALLGPKILLYMALWLLGVGLYDLVARSKPVAGQRVIGWALVVVSAGAYFLAHSLVSGHVESVFRFSGVGPAAVSFGYFLFVAVLTAVAIVGFDRALWGTNIWSDRVASAIRWLAGGSFTLYLTHQPLLLFWGAALPSLRGSAKGALVILLLTIVCAYVFAEFGERRKRFFRQLAERVIPSGRATISRRSTLPSRR